MAVRSFTSFFPTADELLAADLPRLGEILLVHLNSYEGRVKQHGRLNQGYLLAMLENRNVGLGQLPPAPEYGPRQPDVTRRVMEAWNWLERQGFLIPDPSCHGWHLISTEGERLLAKRLAAIPGGASVDAKLMGDNRGIQINGPDDTYLLIEPAGDRYQWCLRNDGLRNAKKLRFEIISARSFSASKSAFRDAISFRVQWPLIEELPAGDLSNHALFVRFEADNLGFGDTTGTHLLHRPKGDPNPVRRWLLSMRVVGLTREWPIELDLRWVLGTKTLELLEHSPKCPEDPASPVHNTQPSVDPFTFYKEPRPLGDNSYPPDDPRWHDFEEATHEAKTALDSLWSDYTLKFASTKSHSEVLGLILDARLKRLDIIADCMLRIFVVDQETGRRYEDWLAELMRAEEKNVLDLVYAEAPHYGRFFDHEKFTHSLLLRQQEYKKRSDERVIGLIRQLRTAPAADAAPTGDLASDQPPENKVNPVTQGNMHVMLLEQIVAKTNIRVETWAADHNFGRTTVFDWKAARSNGKSLKGKVSDSKCAEIEKAIEAAAAELGLATRTSSD